MKQFYLLFIIFYFLSNIGFAQGYVAYGYDDAGNRISRKVITIQTKGSEILVDPAPTEDKLGERKIVVYPNPTKGDLAVEITGGDTKDEIRVILYSVQGKLLQNNGSVVGKTIIDMSAYPTGWYILRVIGKSKIIEFKIIKE